MSGTRAGALKIAAIFAARRGPGLERMKAEAAPGECPFCGDPRAPHRRGRKPLTCGDPACVSAYHRAYGRDRRERKRALVAAQKTGPEGLVVAVCNTRPSTVIFDPVTGGGRG